MNHFLIWGNNHRLDKPGFYKLILIWEFKRYDNNISITSNFVTWIHNINMYYTHCAKSKYWLIDLSSSNNNNALWSFPHFFTSFKCANPVCGKRKTHYFNASQCFNETRIQCQGLWDPKQWSTQANVNKTLEWMFIVACHYSVPLMNVATV